jgi:hypothetical protein
MVVRSVECSAEAVAAVSPAAAAGRLQGDHGSAMTHTSVRRIPLAVCRGHTINFGSRCVRTLDGRRQFDRYAINSSR